MGMKEHSQSRTKIIGWIFHQINSRRRKLRVVFIQGIVPKNTAQSVFGAICLYFEYSREVFLWIFLLLPLSRLLERQVHKKNDQLPICSIWKKRKIFLITECCVCGVFWDYILLLFREVWIFLHFLCDISVLWAFPNVKCLNWFCKYTWDASDNSVVNVNNI